MLQHARPKMYSERQEIVPFDPAEIMRVFHEGVRDVQVVPLENGMHYGPQGAYLVMSTPEGARIGLWAQDPEDLVIGDVTIDEAMEGRYYRLGAGGEKMPLKVGDKLKGRLLDQGNGNLGRIRIFSAKNAYTPQKWLHDEITEHQSTFLAFNMTQGQLMRIDKTRWLSGGIVYQLVPTLKKSKRIQPAHKGVLSQAWDTFLQTKTKTIEGARGTGRPPLEHWGMYPERYDLMMAVAPGYGWELGKAFERVKKKNGMLSASFTRLASLRAGNLTLADAEALVQYDFSKRAHLFLEGRDPYSIHINGRKGLSASKQIKWTRIFVKSKRIRSVLRMPPVKVVRNFMARRPVTKAVIKYLYGSSHLDVRKILRTFGVIGASAIIFSLPLYMLGIPVSAFVLAGRVGGRTMTKTSEMIEESARLRKLRRITDDSDGLYKTYGQNTSDTQILGPRINRKRILSLQAISYEDLNTDRGFGTKVYASLPKNIGLKEYVFGAAQGAPGSVVHPFAIGAHTGLRVVEPGGLVVEYIPEKNVCFAAMDWARLDCDLLPDAVTDAFKGQSADKPFLKITHTKKTGALQMEFISEERYAKAVTKIRNAAYLPDHKRLARDAVFEVSPQGPSFKPGMVRSAFSKMVRLSRRVYNRDVAQAPHTDGHNDDKGRNDRAQPFLKQNP